MLSTLTCITFWLPCMSGEKVTLGLTCFVAYSVFMLMVAEKVPTTSETVPIISIYLTIVMSFTSMSVIMAVIVTNINEKSKLYFNKENRMPKIIRKVFIKYLAKCLGLQKEARDLLKTIVKKKRCEKEKDLDDKCPFFAGQNNESDSDEIWLRNEGYNSNISEFDIKEDEIIDFEKDYTNINVKIRDMKANKKERVKYKVKRENLSVYFAYEYALFGVVLDRFFFWIYASFTLLSYLATLFVIPFLMQSTKKPFPNNIP